MILKYFYDEHLAQASYLVGCAATGEALVVDPARDITPYLAMADKEGLRISHVTETHIHADFVSGSRELAHATGATIYLSDMGTADWKYAYADDPNVILVRDGDSFMVGNVRIQVMHTPGHTPEHISFMLTDTAGANKPMGIFTGDFIFAGDVGRPDLLEAAAGMVGTKEPGARQQFASVERFKALPDYLQIWPGHGAGSACGKALGAIPSTTLGYEKLFNPAFQFDDEDAFVRWLLDGQPEAPRYFAQMKKVNKLGPALLETLPTAARLDRAALDAALRDGALVVDLRTREDFERAHVMGTVSIPATSSNFSTYVGWFVDFDRPMYAIVPSDADADDLIAGLRAIGVDQIGGTFTPDVVDEETTALPVINAQDLAQRLPQNGIRIIDVRGKSEYVEEHIVGAQHIALGYLPQHLQDIPRDTLVVMQCASGYRSQIATSYLRARGFDNIVNLTDGHEVWARALPTEAGA
ncbi:MAG: MBL fold metallo-hydrolase [Anaerolineae bacterium]|nr:MBL fold metallo-hydrolase [Anaerolineae bacterium]